MTTNTYVGEVTAHRSHVKQAMLNLAQLFPIDFNLVTDDLIKEFAEYHDRPKLQTLKTLQRYGYNGRESILDILAQYYGKDRDDYLDQVIKELNRIEDLQKQIFFAKIRLKYPDEAVDIIDQLTQIELIADRVVTKLYRGPELNIAEIERYAGARWLANKDNATFKMIVMAMKLEDKLEAVNGVAKNNQSCANQLQSKTRTSNSFQPQAPM